MRQQLLLCSTYTKRQSKEKGSDDVQSFNCHTCFKQFKTERSLKIHKTKMDHWKTPINSMASSKTYSSSMFRTQSYSPRAPPKDSAPPKVAPKASPKVSLKNLKRKKDVSPIVVKKRVKK